MESFTLFFSGSVLRRMGRESLTHVLIPLALLIDEMVRCCDVIVSVSFKASDRILFFELKVADEPAEKVLRVGHLLKTREEAWLTLLRIKFLLS